MLHSGCAFRGRGSFVAAIAPRPSSSDAIEASQQQHQFHESFYRVNSGGLKTASTSSERELKPKWPQMVRDSVTEWRAASQFSDLGYWFFDSLFNSKFFSKIWFLKIRISTFGIKSYVKNICISNFSKRWILKKNFDVIFLWK